MKRKKLLCLVLNRGCFVHRHLQKGIQQWRRQPGEETDEQWIPIPCSATCFLCYLQHGLQVKHCLTNSTPAGKFKTRFLHCLGAQLSKQHVLQLGSLGVKPVRNLALCCPPQHPLLGRWLVLCNTPSGVCSESSCTQPWSHSHEKTVWQDQSHPHALSCSLPPKNHQSMDGRCILVCGLAGVLCPPFHTKRRSIGLLLWKTHL